MIEARCASIVYFIGFCIGVDYRCCFWKVPDLTDANRIKKGKDKANLQPSSPNKMTLKLPLPDRSEKGVASGLEVFLCGGINKSFPATLCCDSFLKSLFMESIFLTKILIL